MKTEAGTTYHASPRIGYRPSQMFEPCFAWDYKTKNSGKIQSGPDAGTKIDISNGITLGAGLMFHFSPNIAMTASYTNAVKAKNVIETDGVYFKFDYVW